MTRFLIFFFVSAVLAGAVLMLFSASRSLAPVTLFGFGAGIWLTVIVGFATMNPYATIYVMMVLPVQARWIAWFTIAYQIFEGVGLYGGPLQAIVCVGILALFAYTFTSREFRARVMPRGPRGPSLKERYDRWQQRRRMRQWQRRVSKIDKPEDLFKDK